MYLKVYLFASLFFFWKTIVLVLLTFTERPHFEQNFERISRLFCKPTAVCDKIIKSSAYIKQLSFSPFGKMKRFTHSFSHSFGISFIYNINKSGLRTHPCLTPRSYGNDSVHRSAFNFSDGTI